MPFAVTAATASPTDSAPLPSYTSAALCATTGKPAPRLSRRIDVRKLKTKMCAYVLRGRWCPFGDNCAFLHKPKETLEVLTSPVSQQTLQALTSDDSILSDDSRPRSGDDEEDATTVLSIKGTPQSSALLPPPPAYEEALVSGLVVEEMAPPSYPAQFRFSPYTYEGIEFVN